jgi:hypothetical protein
MSFTSWLQNLTFSRHLNPRTTNSRGAGSRKRPECSRPAAGCRPCIEAHARRTTKTRRRTPGCQLRLEQLESRELLTGTWQTLTNTVLGSDGIQEMMLLSDGTVMAQGGNGLNSTAWYKLTPNSGNYQNGIWSNLAPMKTQRRFFASNVLTDGRVFVLGGEYSGVNTTPPTMTFDNTGEIYDPVTNQWKDIANFAQPAVGTNPVTAFGDDPSAMLDGGKVLLGDIGSPNTYIYDPVANTYTPTTGSKVGPNDQSDEESWVTLPDHSILSYDIYASAATNTFQAERYIPSLDRWVNASQLSPTNRPSVLTGSSQGYELGPAFLEPNGNVIFFGANGNTAIYDPKADIWTAGLAEPQKPLTITPNANNTVYSVTAGGNQTFLVATDNPGAMLPNGHILIALSPLGPLTPKGTYSFPTATSVYEFDPNATTTATAFTEVTPANFGLNSNNAFRTGMLVLPTGQVMMANDSFNVELFTPDGSPKNVWKPTVTTIASTGTVSNGKAVYTLTGKQLNGISQGAAYGDDLEMATNYPILKVTDTFGNVQYARTFNWSSTGVATGSTPVSTQFTMPDGMGPGVYKMSVSANGISSNSVLDVQLDNGTSNVTLQPFSLPVFGNGVQVQINGVDRGDFPVGDLSGIIVTGSSADSTINLTDNLPNLPVTVVAGGGTQAVSIAGNAGTGPVTINTTTGTVEVSATLPVTVNANPQTHVTAVQNSLTATITINNAGTVRVGKGLTDPILGRVVIQSGSSGGGLIGPVVTAVSVDDSLDTDPSGRTFTILAKTINAFNATGLIIYDPTHLSSLTVVGGRGHNSYKVGNSNASNNLTNLGSLLSISGSGQDTLEIDDRANTLHGTFTIGHHTLTREAWTFVAGTGRISSFASFGYNGINSLIVDGSGYNNEFDVTDDYRIDLYPRPLAITLNTGTGTNHAILTAATGVLTVAGQGGTDTVDVNGPNVSGSFLDHVEVTNTRRSTTLNIDDSADPANPTVALGYNSVTVIDTSRGYFFFTPTSIANLTVTTGSGHATVEVYDTIPTTFVRSGILGYDIGQTTVNAGLGGATLLVAQTTGVLNFNSSALGILGSDAIAVGTPTWGEPGSLDHIQGKIVVTLPSRNDPSWSYLSVSITDQLSQPKIGQKYTVTLDATSLQRSGSAPIYFGDTPTLLYQGSDAGSNFAVQDTPLAAGLAILGGGTTLRAGAGNSSVNVTGTTGPLTVDLQTGPNSALVVGDVKHSLDAIKSVVGVLIGGGAGQTLTVSDQASTTQQTMVVTDHNVKRGNAFVVQNGTFGKWGPGFSLNVLAGSGGTEFDVPSSAAGVRMQLTGGIGGLDNFAIDPSKDTVLGPISITAQQADGDFASFNDALSGKSHAYTVRSSSITRDGQTLVTFSTLKTLTVDASQVGGNMVNVLGVFANTQANIVAANGDQVVVSTTSPALLVSPIQGILVVSNYVPADQVALTVDDSLDRNGRTITMAPPAGPTSLGSSITGLGQIFWRLGTTSTLLVLGGNGGNAFTVVGALPDVTLTLAGGGGTNSLLFDDTAITTPQVYTNHAGEFNLEGSPAVQYSRCQTVTLNAGAGSDPVTNTLTVVDVWSTSPGTSLLVNCGPGMEEIGFVAEQNAIQGPVKIQGQPGASDHIFYDDGANPNSQSYTFTTNKVTRSDLTGAPDLADLTFEGVVQVILFEPSVGGNQTNVQSVAAGTLCNVLDYNGDHVVIGSLAPNLGGNLKGILGPVEVHSRDPINDPMDQVSLVIDDSGNTDTTPQQVTFSQSSPGDPYIYMDGLEPATTSIVWWLTPASSVTVLGGAANKTFAMQPFVSATPLTINAGGGTNTLDYSAYSTDVYVNLQTSTATDLAGMSNIQNVTGGAGNNILVGNGGNVLTGGNGFNLLIAGATASTLTGGSGNDILIGGTTNYDTDQATLTAILAEWVANHDTPLLDATTVLSNGAANQLTGGTGNDLFFARLAQELLDFDPNRDTWVQLA